MAQMIRPPLSMAAGRAPKQGQQVNFACGTSLLVMFSQAFLLGVSVFDRGCVPRN